MKLGRISRRVSSVIAALGLVLGMFVVAAPQASASYGNVWVATPRWAGHCPGSNNYVTGIKYTVWSSGWSASGGDFGDDRIYPTVRRYQENRFQLAVHCRWTLPYSVVFSIWPGSQAFTYAPNVTGTYVHVW